MGSLAGSPWHFRKIIGRSGLQASKTWGHFPPADCPSGRLCEGGLGLKISKKKAPRGPAPRSRPREGRLQEAVPSAGGPDRALKICTHITAMRRGVATAKPATLESRSTPGHSTPYGRPSPVRRGTVAILTMMSPTTSRQYDPWAAGPIRHGDTRRRPGHPSRPGVQPIPSSRPVHSLEGGAPLRR